MDKDIKGESIFGKGNAGIQIADKLLKTDLDFVKRMTY